MPFGGPLSGPTPGRRTIVTLDDFLPGVLQVWTAVQRQGGEIARTANATTTNVAYRPGVGWRLRSYQQDFGDARELDAAQAGILVPGTDLELADKFVSYDSFNPQSLSGVTYASGVASGPAGPFVQKRVPAGESWASRLTGDQSTYPAPDVADDSTDMDRAAKGSASHEPWDEICFAFFAPASALSTSRSLATLYFCGPASFDVDATADITKAGLGQYALKIRGDGRALLYEKLDNGTWKRRFAFYWSTEDRAVRSEVAYINVCSNAYQDGEGNWIGDTISFLPRSFGDGPGIDLVNTVAQFAAAAMRLQSGQYPVYRVPKLAERATTLAPVRVDVARNVRAGFQISHHIYQSEGVLVDDVLSTEAPLTGDEPLWVYWEANVPSGTSLVCKAIDAESGANLSTSIGVTHSGRFYRQAFTPISRMRAFRIRYEFGANTTKRRTPTLVGYSSFCAPVYTTTNPLTPVTIPQRSSGMALPRTLAADLSVKLQDADPNSENASLRIFDMTGELSQIGNRPMMPISIDVEVPEGEGTATASLFRGYIHTAEAEVRRFANSNPDRYPRKQRRVYQAQCAGEWARLSEAIAPRKYPWETNPSTGEPWKVTDIVRFLLTQVYPDSMVDVPDLAIELYAGEASSYLTEPGARIGDAAKAFAEDWLGAYLLFDPAAGDRGMWRLLAQKTPPYRNLAVFEYAPTAGGSNPRLVHHPGSYPAVTLGGQEVPVTYMAAGTVRTRSERAEGNLVTVIGAAVGSDSSSAGSQGGALLTQIAVKVDSFNFLNLDPSHANFPDGSAPEFVNRVVPIRAVDYRLSTQRAVDFRARRIFDRACFVRSFLTFDAPLLLITDPDDSLQQRLRPLRYYDAVLARDVDSGELMQYLVLDVQIHYQRDHNQMASYTLVTQENINEVATMPYPRSFFASLRKAFDRMVGRSQFDPGGFAAQNAGATLGGIPLGLPELRSSLIQDLDPDSSTFGQFVGPDGY